MAGRWPSGTPSGKGGQFAPKNTTGGGFAAKHPGMTKPVAASGGGQKGYFSALHGGEDTPKGPPPGAKPHPQKNDKGESVTINYPTKASDKGAWADPTRTATFLPHGDVPDALHGVAFSSWKAPKTEADWQKVSGQNPKLDADHPFDATPGKNVGAGVIIREPDGRIWLTRPTNAFGGYQNTFPKGTVEHGLSMQASAIKEAYEETGLRVKIVGVLGDYERSTSKARYYVAERVGGTPKDMGWESQAMRLAAPKDASKLLNVQVDKGILADFHEEHVRKTKGGSKGHFNEKQARWPGGTPLGGQWMAVGADGIVMPPKIAGGLEGKNAAYQKKANALHALAQAGDVAEVKKYADGLKASVEANEKAGKNSSHVKWTAQVSQYATKLHVDLTAAPMADAAADRISGPLDLAKMTSSAPKPGGSNPGGIYKDSKGNSWLVKGNAMLVQGQVTKEVSDDRAKNEVLAAKIMHAAGAPAPEMKLVQLHDKFGGGLGAASKWVGGVEAFNPYEASHVEAIQKHYAIHAWLANFDVLGQGFDNTVIKDGRAVNIDPGGAILFRAQGLKKDSFGKDASEWESMRTNTKEQKAVFGKMTASQLQESAKALAAIDNNTINKLVDTYGPGDAKGKADLASTLIARRDAILQKAGLNVSATGAAPAPAPKPPRLKDAVKPPGGPVPSSIVKPTFTSGLTSDGYYTNLVNQAEAAHKAGDIAALKGIVNPKKPGTWMGATVNSQKLVAYHTALLIDLDKQQAVAIAAVADGHATVKDATGKEWTGDKGVLHPVAAAGSPLRPSQIKEIAIKNIDESAADFLVSNLHDEAATKTYPMFILASAAAKGDLAAVQAFDPFTVSLTAMKAGLIAAMTAQTPGATAKSPAPALMVPKAAAPTFDKHILASSNTNAAAHNPKILAIKAAFEKGDEKALLAMNFGTNTYGKKQAAVANDALAVLGSVHQVSPGQKANAHLALIAGAAQPNTPYQPSAIQSPPPAPASNAGKAPKPTLKDLTVDKLPPVPDLFNWNGKGSPYSSKEWKNSTNTEALVAIQQAALKGGMEAVNALKFPELDPNTGTPTGQMLTIDQHPAKKIIGAYATSVSHGIHEFLNPPRPLAAFNLINAQSVQEAAAKFVSAPIFKTVDSAPKDQQFGFWLALGKIENPGPLVPPTTANISSTQKAAGKKAFGSYSAKTKQWVQFVQSSGAINRAYDEGKTTYNGIDLKETAKALYADATPLPAGAILHRWQKMPPGMVKQIESAEPGLVFQSGGGWCTSIHPTNTSHFGNHKITMIAAPGAKAIHSHGSGGYSSEEEITTLPGQRFVVTSKKKVGDSWHIEVLMLPPDEKWTG
ncbi:Nudix_Hydrolase domain containing protein [uncultured Caudovirales phage]|uniref:Nudix_Hydrolase domain containing protein n=2 Tax=uncultured Caudovirales phage TaxID=2100421 RepID=A0A6J5KUF8_9CAUD|nr:Nudix_Hydrolase domain containing protein [uncultured Caudovirales phage]